MTPLEQALKGAFPQYWHTLERDEDGATLRFDYDPAEPIFDKLKAMGFHEDDYPSVDRDMREGYQCVTHHMVHPEFGCVDFSHSVSWEMSLFEIKGGTSEADELTWESGRVGGE